MKQQNRHCAITIKIIESCRNPQWIQMGLWKLHEENDIYKVLNISPQIIY